MTDHKTRLIAGLVSGLVLAAGTAALRGLFTAPEAAERVRCLCDGFFVAAVLLGGLGGLTWVRNQGVFDSAVYSVKTAFSVRWRMFGDYRESREEYQDRKAKGRGPAGPLLLAGGVYLLVSVALLAGYLALVP